jgi:peroxiredoxin
MFAIAFQSCGQNKEKNYEQQTQIQSKEPKKNVIDFSEAETPDFFTAQTIKGKQINSKDYLGKNVVLLITRADFEGKMADGFNELFSKYENNKNVTFLTIIDGDEKDDLTEFLSKYNAEADFVDNRRKASGKQIEHNFHCWPAMALMDGKGKVVYAGCGGYGFADEYLRKLDSLVTSKK